MLNTISSEIEVSKRDEEEDVDGDRGRERWSEEGCDRGREAGCSRVGVTALMSLLVLLLLCLSTVLILIVLVSVRSGH